MAAHPNGTGPGPHYIPAADPYPAAIPGPIARRPDIIGTRSDWNVLHLRRRGGRRGHDRSLRGRSGWLWRRCGRRSLPVSGRRRRSGPRGSRLGLVNNSGRWRRLDDVCRLGVVHGHISNLAMRTTSDQGRNPCEREARGPHVNIHEIKILHIQRVGRRSRAGSSAEMQKNVRRPCNLLVDRLSCAFQPRKSGWACDS
jgi:hypothetical protein